MRKELQGKTAILYRRVSTTDQKENGNSLNTQQHSLRTFANNSGMDIIREFQEDFSAKNFERPEFNRLLDFVKKNKNKVDYILITSWDRFSRNTYEALRVIGEMRELSIEVNSVENWIDHNDPYQLMMQLMYLGMPEVDNRVKSQKVTVNMRQGLKEGRWNRNQPLGYIKGKDPTSPKRPLMQIHPEKGELVRELFKDFSLGVHSQNDILKMNKYKSLKLSKSNLSRILKNPIYKGVIVVPAYGEESEEIIEALHEPLIDHKTFKKVQDCLNLRKKYNHKQSKLNENLPLRGHLECPKCKSNLTGSPSRGRSGKRHYYYHCQNNKGCNFRVNVKDAHGGFDELLESLNPGKEVVELFKLILEEKFNQSEASTIKQSKSLNSKIEKIDERRKKLLNTLLDGVIDNETYKESNELLTKDKSEAIQGLENLKSHKNELKEYVNFGANLMENIKELYHRVDVRLKDKLLSSILNEKLVFLNKKYRTPQFKDAFSFIYSNIKGLQTLGIKKGDTFSNTSLNVPLTVQLSNTFYDNLYELYDFREVLINEGIMDNNGYILPMTELQSNSNIPYRN